MKELLNAKRESNRNNKEVGEEWGGKMCVISKSLCPGKDGPRATASAPSPSVHGWGLGQLQDLETAQQPHTQALRVSRWETTVLVHHAT